jgi:hypothetical protein
LSALAEMMASGTSCGEDCARHPAQLAPCGFRPLHIFA